MAPDRTKFLRDEVKKLVEARILREVKYQTWVANPVMVRKPDNSWRMCVDFTDINKACSKVNYPLPEIDWKVESINGYQFKSFLDASKGYHQIPMAMRDQDKTAFHTPDGIFCYIMMPFGLKNAGATYQRLIDKTFKDQIGRNVEAYVDDIVIKSHTEDSMLRDTLETFESLRKVNMKLNPKKCTFGVEEGKFLGYVVTKRGIKANPKKIQAIEDMVSPKTKKEVQSLNGSLAALTRFLSRAADRSLPFMKVLKSCLNKRDFKWTKEAENAFQNIKQLLKELPTLTAPIAGENIKKFVWNDIVCRYGLPNEIVSDNGKQFADNHFRSWCEELNIKQTFNSVAHPQANGQAEVTNKEIVAGIKARLGLSQTKWVDEVPYVLWAHRTTPKRSTGETPFSLMYGTEAVIPAEIRVPTERILAFDIENNSSILRENLNLLEERRIMAAIRQADAKQKMAKYYNKRVRYVQFKEGDLVLRDNEASRQEKQGKLGPRWEGPYKITKMSQYSVSSLPTKEKFFPRWQKFNHKQKIEMAVDKRRNPLNIQTIECIYDRHDVKIIQIVYD
ncbi:uncharacterized protein [Rutidosis leptorrhynchoides]|uniref:uncharacterized protein n=1 Tax=Rutidosis leptorrhynchoides TaxID=125765 RepID=UPI003A9950E3